MTTQNQAVEAILERWRASWGTTTPTAFPNEVFRPPDDEAWVRLHILHAESEQETLGGVGKRRFLRGGSIFLSVFTIADAGTEESDGLVDQARDVFEGTNFSGVWCAAGVPRTIGTDGRYWQVNVEIRFTYEVTK